VSHIKKVINSVGVVMIEELWFVSQKRQEIVFAPKRPFIYLFIYLFIFIGSAAQRWLWPPRSRGFSITYNDAFGLLGQNSVSAAIWRRRGILTTIW
jgi:hypothetical protein